MEIESSGCAVCKPMWRYGDLETRQRHRNVEVMEM